MCDYKCEIVKGSVQIAQILYTLLFDLPMHVTYHTYILYRDKFGSHKIQQIYPDCFHDCSVLMMCILKTISYNNIIIII